VLEANIRDAYRRMIRGSETALCSDEMSWPEKHKRGTKSMGVPNGTIPGEIVELLLLVPLEIPVTEDHIFFGFEQPPNDRSEHLCID